VKRIAILAILFAALIEFAIERERFDLWIVTAALLTLLWSLLRRNLRSRAGLHKQDARVPRPGNQV
jgi:hypothetical protein